MTPGGPDLLRVKVWKAGAPALVLYDTQPGAGELDRPTLRVVDGGISVRKA